MTSFFHVPPYPIRMDSDPCFRRNFQRFFRATKYHFCLKWFIVEMETKAKQAFSIDRQVIVPGIPLQCQSSNCLSGYRSLLRNGLGCEQFVFGKYLLFYSPR
jgi:hypothetical protein